MWAKLKWFMAWGVAAVFAVCAGYLYVTRPRAGAPVVRAVADAPTVVREIQQLSELVTVRYSLQKVIGLEEQKIPFGAESLLLLVRAEVLAGVDLAQLTEADVIIRDTTARVRLPPAKILRVYLDDKHTRVWDRRKTWWTPWVGFNPELDQKARRVALEDVQVAALEMGILREAEVNARRAVERLLMLLGFTAVEWEGTAS